MKDCRNVRDPPRRWVKGLEDGGLRYATFTHPSHPPAFHGRRGATGPRSEPRQFSTIDTIAMCSVLIMLTVFFGISATTSTKYKRQNLKIEPPSAPNDKLVMYNYDYIVDDGKAGVYMSRWEERRGDYTRGEYSLLDPGGSVRTVDYEVVDGNGFKAKMSTNLPGYLLLSTQQYLRSMEIHPQQPLELDPIPSDESTNEIPTFNYHKDYHEKIGYRKMEKLLRSKYGSA